MAAIGVRVKEVGYMKRFDSKKHNDILRDEGKDGMGWGGGWGRMLKKAIGG